MLVTGIPSFFGWPLNVKLMLNFGSYFLSLTGGLIGGSTGCVAHWIPCTRVRQLPPFSSATH